MKLQDTLSNSVKDLDVSQQVRVYLCGVTVYDESHIGHARTIIVFDVLRRYLENKEIEVNFIQNFTDVDDKIINRAKLENVTAEEISSKYIQHYFSDFDGLNVKRATNYPKATEHIKDILDLIEKLISKNIAYTSKTRSVNSRFVICTRIGRPPKSLRSGSKNAGITAVPTLAGKSVVG